MSAGTTRPPGRSVWQTVLSVIQPDDHLSAVIYGQLITGATLASAVGAERTLLDVVLVTVTTIVVFSIADVYAELVGNRATTPRQGSSDRDLGPSPFRPWPYIRRVLVMVSACLPALTVLVIASLLGASMDLACYLGLTVIVVSLIGYGFRSARHGNLRPARQVMVALLFGILGGAIILLKAEVLH